MKSTDMKISVRRNENGVPAFKYPTEWDWDTTFLNICELCCRLFEELQELKKKPTFEEVLEEVLESDTLTEVKKYGHLVFSDVHFDDIGQEIEITIFEYHNKIYVIKYVGEECVMFDNITPCKEETK